MSESESSDDQTPNFTDDEIEDFPDELLCPDMLLERPVENQTERNIVIVDRMPIINGEKLTKFRKVMQRLFQPIGTICNEFYPFGTDGNSKGYAFFEFENEEQAVEAVRLADGYRLDRVHTFSANLMSKFDELTRLATSSSEVEREENFYSWLYDSNATDQFAVQIDGPKKIEIYENTRPAYSIFQRTSWSDGPFVWSPRGTYFASFHALGVLLWAGKEFRQVQRFAHNGVSQIEFSPCERFLISTSLHPAARHAFLVWDVLTGRIQREFPFDRQTTTIFRWAFDGEFFAKKGTDGLHVYNTQNFQLVDRQGFRAVSLVDFQWSTTDHRFVFWTNAEGNLPARLVLAEVKENQLREIRSKPLINVLDCQFVWQTSGDYLVVKVQRYTKKSGDKANPRYSGVVSNFEIFSLRERDVSLDTFEVKENVQSFSVEPDGHKLAVITEGNVTFYRLGQNQKIGVITQPVGQAIWSPRGQFVVLTSRSNGLLIFVDSNELTVMIKQEHPFLAEIEWDPTGRYIASWSNVFTTRRDHCLKIWTFDSREFSTTNLERLVNFRWRPRPRSLLTDEMIKEIQRNRSIWTQKFAREDRFRNLNISQKLSEERQRKLREFQTLRERMAERLVQQAEQRRLLRNRPPLEEPSSNHEETIEFLVDSKETVHRHN